MSFLAISFPCTPACSWTQYSPTVCQAEIFNTFWHCCTNGDTALATGRAVRAITGIFLWSNIHLNFISTGQDSIYLSLKNCIILSYKNTEPSSHWLPICSSPFLHPVPICKPDEPFNYRRNPRSSGPLFSSQHSNPSFGFKIESWPHNINPHIKYRLWLLKLHQYATMSSIRVKVRPTSQAPETMRNWTRLTLNYQLQWWEASKCFHSTRRGSVHRSRYP